MPSLDAIYTQFGSKGLEVLSITDEDPIKVSKFLARTDYHPPVLIDTDDAVHKRFHIEGIPHTFVFDRDGKLVGSVSINARNSNSSARLAQRV